ncbi:hypothetical protein [Mesorhizobium sp. C372A]|uniref:hypothetical protein n=1 Tax=Mesorhizobium sp. C372A TaxID=2956829 RepID=UPI00336ACA9A
MAERLSPMDLLRISHTNQELRVAVMIVATPQERRIQVQAICGSPCTGRQQRLVVVAEGPRDPDDCATALWGLGAGVAALAPELQRRLILLAEGLEPRSQTIALEGLGAGVGGGHSSLSHTYEYVWLKQTDGYASKPKPSSSRTNGNCAILLDMSVSSWSRIASTSADPGLRSAGHDLGSSSPAPSGHRSVLGEWPQQGGRG